MKIVRKEGFGYLPDMLDVRGSIENILVFYKETKSTLNFKEFITKQYGSKSDSTIRLIQNSLINYGLITEVDDYMYQTSELGRAWLRNCSAPELVKLIHEHIAFIGEILDELKVQQLNAKGLTRCAKLHYGIDVHGADLTRRTQFLRSAAMVQMNRRKMYILTAKGAAFLKTLKLNEHTKCYVSSLEFVSIEAPNDKYTNSKSFSRKIPFIKEKDSTRDKISHYGCLIKEIMECLCSRRENPVTNGWLNIQAIYICIYGRAGIKLDLKEQEIEDVLEFLSSSVIGCVACDKAGESDKYVANGDIHQVKRILDVYLDALNGEETMENRK